MPKKISISVAKEVAEKTGHHMVIVIGIDNDRSGAVATYGKSTTLCKLAGVIGQEYLSKFLFDDETGVLTKDVEELLSEVKP